MEWKLNDDRPIWLQLAEQMTRRIITGVYPPGSKLPPVRELAAEAGVNPNTMQRALAQLEQDGLAKADRTAGGWSPKTPLYWMRYGGRRPMWSSTNTITPWQSWATPSKRPRRC